MKVVKVEFTAGLYCTALHHTGVPNKVATKRILTLENIIMNIVILISTAIGQLYTYMFSIFM